MSETIDPAASSTATPAPATTPVDAGTDPGAIPAATAIDGLVAPAVAGEPLAAFRALGMERPDDIDRVLQPLLESGLDPRTAAEIKAGGLPSRGQQDQMRTTLTRLSNDAAWVKRYMDGGEFEARQMAHINAVLGLPSLEDVAEGIA